MSFACCNVTSFCCDCASLISPAATYFPSTTGRRLSTSLKPTLASPLFLVEPRVWQLRHHHHQWFTSFLRRRRPDPRSTLMLGIRPKNHPRAPEVALLGILLQWYHVRRWLPFPYLLQPTQRGIAPVVIFAIAPATGVIFGFIILWGDLAPPIFSLKRQRLHVYRQFSLCVISRVVSILGVYVSPTLVILMPF